MKKPSTKFSIIARRCGHLTLVGMALAVAASGARATEITVVGLFPTKAVVVINNAAPKTMSIGQRSAEGITLVAVGSDTATFEIEGKPRQLRMGQHYAATPASGGDRVVLSASSGGHVLADARINGGAIRMLVDTGATSIALSATDARRLGINHLNAPRVPISTANGTTFGHRVSLDTVSIGAITINNVEAIVLEQGLGTALLGMSFLARTSMQRDGDTLVLTKRF